MKLIAVDLDGTLLNHDKEILEGSRKAIAKATEAGIRVVVASGRSNLEAQGFVKDTACDRWLICSNGAVIVDRMTGERHKVWQIPRETAAETVRRGEECGLRMFLYIDDEIWMTNDTYEQIFSKMRGFQVPGSMLHLTDDLVGDVASCEGVVTKLMGWSMDADKKRRAKEWMSELPGLTFTSSGPDNFEIMAEGAGKGEAIRWLAQELGISMDETAAIGDSDNDLNMLHAVRHPIAMGNASDHVKEQVEFVTGTCNTDGIERAIAWVMEQDA